MSLKAPIKIYKRISWNFAIQSPRLGKKVLEFHYVSKEFPGIKILSEFFYKWIPGEKVGIIGPNGSGKSSFLKLITGELKPDKGKIVIGESVRIGYYGQDGLVGCDDMRVLDVIRNIAEYIPGLNGKKITG